MASKDEFDFDFDDGLDDLLTGMDDTVGDMTTNEKTSDRSPTVKVLKEGARGFVESYTDDPLEAVSKIAETALPDSVSTEVNDIRDIAGSLKEEYKSVAKEVKRTAASTLKVVERVIPKNDLTNKVMDKLNQYVGAVDEEREARINAEEQQRATIAEYIKEGMGGDKLNNIESLFKETLDHNRAKTAIELQNITATSLREISAFNKQIANSYFRKSIELQYKSLFVSKQQLDVTKHMADVFKDELSAIAKNTGLPDIIKLKTTEGIKATLRQKATMDIADKLFTKNSLLENTKSRIQTIGGNIRGKVIDGLTTVGDLAEQKEMMSGMEVPGETKGSMAGSVAGDFFKTILGDKIGAKIAGTKRGRDLIFNFKTLLSDPSSFIKGNATNMGYGKGFVNDRTVDAMGFASDVLKKENKLNTVKFEKDDLSDAKMFDGRAYSSITKIIPGLLSKIYGEIKGMRTGTEATDHELSFDHDKDTFTLKKDVVSNFKSSIKKDIKKNTAKDIDNVIKIFKYYGGLKISGTSDVKAFRTALVKYISAGKPIVPTALERNGFIDLFPGKLKKSVKSALRRLLVNSRKDPSVLDKVIYAFEEVSNNIPNINKKLEELVDNGNKHDLFKQGYLTYDEDSEAYSSDENTLSKLLLDTTGSLGVDNELVGDIDRYKFEGIKSKSMSDVVKDTKRKNLKRYAELKKKAKFNPEVKNGIKQDIEKAKESIKEAYKERVDSISKIKITKDDLLKSKTAKERLKEEGKEILGTDKVILTPEEESALKEEFLSSKAYTEGTVKTYKQYKESLGVTSEDDATLINKLTYSVKRKKDKIRDDVTQYLKDRFNPKLKKLTSEKEEELKEEFLNSKAYQEGKVIDFSAYVRAMGFKPKLNIGSILKKTRALDRKIMVGAGKLIGKAPGALFRGLGTGGRMAMSLGGSALSGAGIIAGSVGKQFTGYDHFNKDEDDSILAKTRGLDRSISKKAVKSPFVLTKAAIGYTKTLLDGMKKKDKKNPFDKDGDGDRDGNWKDRLKSFMPTGIKGDKKKGLLEVVKNNKKASSAMLLTGLLVAMKAMGVTMEDVSGFVSGAVGAMKNVGHVISKIWEVLKDSYKAIKNLGSSIVDGVSNTFKAIVPSWMRGGDDKKKSSGGSSWYNPMSWFGSDDKKAKPIKKKAMTPQEKANLDDYNRRRERARKQGRLEEFDQARYEAEMYSKPNGYTRVIQPAEENLDLGLGDGSSAIGASLVYGVGGFAAYKGGRKAYGMGKTTYNAGKAVYETGKSAVNVVQKVAPKVANNAKYVKSMLPKSDSKLVTNIKDKLAKGKNALSKVVPKAKVKAGRIKTFLKMIKKKILLKVGKRAGAKLLAKLAARLVPFAGLALLAYDATMITYDMVANGTGFKEAVSNQVLGFNIFDDSEPAVDEDGNPIKPDVEEDEYIKAELSQEDKDAAYIDEQIAKRDAKRNKKDDAKAITNRSKGISSGGKKKLSELSPEKIAQLKRLGRYDSYEEDQMDVPADTGVRTIKHVNKTIADNLLKNNKVGTTGDGEDKPSGVPVNNASYKGGGARVIVRGGELFDPEGGDENITKPSNVNIDNLNPAMLSKLKAMANEYNEITGKKLPINSAYRSTADQIRLRKKYGTRAAKPGYSTHEFGLAADINGSVLDELDELGLLGKYKFTRPIGGEKWHMEPAGIQLDVNNAKKDPSYAERLIDGVEHGGSGWGLVNGVRKYSRNKDYQKNILRSKPTKVIEPKDDKKVDSSLLSTGGRNKHPGKVTSSVKPVVKDETIPTNESKPTSSTIAFKSEQLKETKSNNLIKPMNAAAEITKNSHKVLSSIDGTLRNSLDTQMRMLNKLDELVTHNRNMADNITETTIEASNVVKRNNPNKDREPLPTPAVSVARGSF